eukprot:COSAG02_NODE_3093_length_7383_cov_2.908018_7_plen_83_part_00
MHAMSAVSSVNQPRRTGFLHCIANAPRTRAALDKRFASSGASAHAPPDDAIRILRSLSTRGAFDRQQSIRQFDPNTQYFAFR